MEDEQKEEHPSLPPNYVTLTQLRERWLKEQQRKQKEKEEEDERHKGKPKEIEEQKWMPEYERAENHIENVDKAVVGAVPFDRRRFRRNRRNKSEKDRSSVEVRDSNSDFLKVENIVCSGEEQKAEKSERRKKKTKKIWNNKKRNPRVDEILGGGSGTAQVLPQNVSRGEIPVAMTVKNVEKNPFGSEEGRNSDNQGIGNERVAEDKPVEIERNFENLTLIPEKNSNVKSGVDMNGRTQRYRGYNGRYGGRKIWNRGDCNLVWVKKRECSETPNTGSLNEA